MKLKKNLKIQLSLTVWNAFFLFYNNNFMGTGSCNCSNVTGDGGNEGTLPTLLKQIPGETLVCLFVWSQFGFHCSQNVQRPELWLSWLSGLYQYQCVVHEVLQLWIMYSKYKVSSVTWHARTPLLTLNIKGLHHIVIDELKVFMANPVLDVPFPPREEVIHHSHLMAVHHQLVSEVGTHKTSPTSNLAQIKANKQKKHACIKKKKIEIGNVLLLLLILLKLILTLIVRVIILTIIHTKILLRSFSERNFTGGYFWKKLRQRERR